MSGFGCQLSIQPVPERPGRFLRPEQFKEARQKGFLIGFHILQPRVRESCFICFPHMFQDFSQRLRNGSALGTCSSPKRILYPAVQRVGRQLAFKHRRGIQEHPRGIHRPGNHRARFMPEVQVMRYGVGHGHDQRIAGTSSCTTGPLNVAGLPGWNRALQHG